MKSLLGTYRKRTHPQVYTVASRLRPPFEQPRVRHIHSEKAPLTIRPRSHLKFSSWYSGKEYSFVAGYLAHIDGIRWVSSYRSFLAGQSQKASLLLFETFIKVLESDFEAGVELVSHLIFSFKSGFTDLEMYEFCKIEWPFDPCSPSKWAFKLSCNCSISAGSTDGSWS